MSIITYEDILFVMKTDSKFRFKMLTLKFVKELKENYAGFDDIEDYLYYEACYMGKLKVIKFILNDLVESKKISSNIYFGMLDAGLNRAVDGSYYKVAMWLVNEGADPTNSANHSIRWAAFEGNIKFLKLVKTLKFNFAYKNDQLLDEVLEYGHNWKTIEFLVNEGLRKPEYLTKALDYALTEDNIYMVNFLVEKGADLEKCKYAYTKFLYK